jgi:hypothetical protein
MKCQSKIEVSVSNPLGGVDHILIYGKMYECELTPKIYDPITFDIEPSSYIVICEDGKSRKYYIQHFKDIAELREEKLNQLGI